MRNRDLRWVTRRRGTYYYHSALTLLNTIAGGSRGRYYPDKLVLVSFEERKLSRAWAMLSIQGAL